MAHNFKSSVETGFGTAAPARLQRAEAVAEGFALVIVPALLLVFAVWAWSASRGTRLVFDELLEIAAATAPTRGQVLASLAEGVDFNPPLSHFAIRYSMALLGNTEVAARLPAFLGFATMLICLYAFLSRELGRSYGVLAMLVILCSPVRLYAVQARPYGLVLGLTGLILVLYRLAARQSKRSFALLGIAFCAAALAATHYYAVLVVAVLLGAEGFRTYERKRLDWAVLLGCTAPPIAVLWLLHDAIRRQRLQLTHYFSRGNLLSFDHGYDFLAVDPLVYCLALALLAGVLGLLWASGKPPATIRVLMKPRLSDIAFAMGLLLLPIIGACVTQFITHAYVPRYFLPAAVGFVVCLCYAVKWFSAVVPAMVALRRPDPQPWFRESRFSGDSPPSGRNARQRNPDCCLGAGAVRHSRNLSSDVSLLPRRAGEIVGGCRPGGVASPQRLRHG